jgi:hypothetical protein
MQCSSASSLRRSANFALKLLVINFASKNIYFYGKTNERREKEEDGQTYPKVHVRSRNHQTRHRPIHFPDFLKIGERLRAIKKVPTTLTAIAFSMLSVCVYRICATPAFSHTMSSLSSFAAGSVNRFTESKFPISTCSTSQPPFRPVVDSIEWWLLLPLRSSGSRELLLLR